MGFFSFFKKVFAGDIDEDDPVLNAARARHNIDMGETKEEKERRRREEAQKYDPWEEIDNMRRNFFMGSWASRQVRWRPRHDKLREELEEIERKREEKRKAKEEGRG
jgi:hypothetical protein